MRFSTIVSVLLAAGLASAQANKGGQNKGGQNNNQNKGQNNNNNQNKGGNNNNNNNNKLCLQQDNVQQASNSDGQNQGAEAGRAASLTDPANFINFCTGKTKTNGLQVKQGSCNGVVMGEIPAVGQMVSAVIVKPANGEVVKEGANIDFVMRVANLQAGSFTNPDVTYYAAPQVVKNGKVVGHTHFTVQDIGNNDKPQQPLDAQTFAFFKGVNDAGNGNGELKATLTGGLAAGNYRVCTMTSASNHQPVVMPVAQRGAQDDCIRFSVAKNGGNGGNNNNNNNNNQNKGQNNGGNNNQNKGQNNQQNKGQQNKGQQGGQGKGKGGGRRFGRKKFAAREFIA